MTDTLQCPGCNARLALPAMSDIQMVQCPRCRRCFPPAAPQPWHREPARASTAAHDEVDAELAPARGALAPAARLRGNGMGIAAMVLLGLAAISCGLQIWIKFQQMRLLNDWIAVGGKPLAFMRPPFPALDAREHNLHEEALVADTLHFFVLAAAGFCFLVWLHRASSRCAGILRADGLRFNRKPAIAWFIVPFLNLILPYLAIQEIWRASHPRATDDSTAWQKTPRLNLIAWWWLLLLAGMVLMGVSIDTNFGEFDDFIVNRVVGIPQLEAEWRVAQIAALGHGCFFLAALLLIVVISAISRRQQARFHRLYDDDA